MQQSNITKGEQAARVEFDYSDLILPFSVPALQNAPSRLRGPLELRNGASENLELDYGASEDLE